MIGKIIAYTRGQASRDEAIKATIGINLFDVVIPTCRYAR